MQEDSEEQEQEKVAPRAASVHTAGASNSGVKPSPRKGRPPKSPAKAAAAAMAAKSPAKVVLAPYDDGDDEEQEDEVLPCKKCAKVDSKQRAAA